MRPAKTGWQVTTLSRRLTVFKCQSEVLEAAGGPEARPHGGAGRGHDAPVVRTVAVLGVVLHPEVVAHLVSHGGGHQPDDLAVPPIIGPFCAWSHP